MDGPKLKTRWDNSRDILNIFDGHYPTCNHKKREVLHNSKNVSLEAGLLFKSIDINGNNAITVKEADDYLKNNTKFKRSLGFSLEHELKIMDTNNDDTISPDEFDESLNF